MELGLGMKTFLACLVIAGAVGGATVQFANADNCVSQCRNAHNQCRIATKGSPSCDAHLQACLDSCRPRR
jgi:hypothetical protein